MKQFFEGNPVSRDYRALASKLCQPQIGKLALIYFLYALITAVVGAIIPVVGGLLVALGTCAFAFSFINIAKNVYLGIKVKTGDLFSGFNDFGRAVLISLLMSLYLCLWSLIPIVGPFIALVKGFSYSLAPYIAIDNPNMGYNDCITRSREIMDGNKWQLFCIQFSYIGWLLLSLLTFGILLFWVQPRMEQANFLFYLKVTGIGLEVEKETEKLASEA